MCHSDTIIELSLPSELGYEKLVRQAVAWLGPRLGFNAARVADIQTALSEACINAIEHGNQNLRDRRVDVQFHYSTDHFDAVIADEGVARYQPAAVAPATIEQKVAGLAPARGMGLLMIDQLVDEAAFLPAALDRGNQYWMRVYCAMASHASAHSAHVAQN